MRRLVVGFLAGAATVAVGTAIAYAISLGIVALVAKVNDLSEANLFILSVPLVPSAGVWLWLGKVRRDLVNLPAWLSVCEMLAAACILAVAVAVAVRWFPLGVGN